MLVDAAHPERQPAVARLERRDAQRRITIHHAGADERRHVAHAAPRMRRRALQPEVLPGVEPARRIGGHNREGVEHHGQVMLLRRCPYRLERWMIERHAIRRVPHHRPGPA